MKMRDLSLAVLTALAVPNVAEAQNKFEVLRTLDRRVTAQYALRVGSDFLNGFGVSYKSYSQGGTIEVKEPPTYVPVNYAKQEVPALKVFVGPKVSTEYSFNALFGSERDVYEF